SLGNFRPVDEIEEDSERGASARKQAGEYLARHGRAEINIPGITFGGRYDGSPIIITDGTLAPPDRASDYVPTATPGGRPPHAWLPDGRSLYDTFDSEWSLLALDADQADVQHFVRAAQTRGLDFKVVQPDQQTELKRLYQASLTLIRPDHMV